MDTPLTAVPDTSPPQAELRTVMRIGLTGLSITAVAGLMGLAIDYTFHEAPDWASRVRNALTPLGILVAGCAISMRPLLPQPWLIGAAAGAVGVLGFVPEWDSARLVCGVFSGVSLLAALLVVVSPLWRYVVASALMLFHFAGILSAVTSPHPTPWLSQQAWVRVFRPYLQFSYMNNAYQFYSPDPGPASEAWICFEFQTRDAVANDGPAKPQAVKRWTKFPRRPQHWRDPLGQTYFRRLAMTEQMVSWGVQSNISQREQSQVFSRRQQVPNIPLHPDLLATQQHRPPSDAVRRVLIPSYARFLAHEYDNVLPGMELKSMKIYRAQHTLVSPERLINERPAYRLSPYDPTTYHVIYLGEYDRDGNLVNSLDPMIYWVIPIVRKPGIFPEPPPRMDELSDEDYQRYYDDYVSQHAGKDHRKELLP